MYTKRFLISFVAAFVLLMGMGFLVHGLWLAPDYGALPNVMRTQEDADAHFQFMILAHVFIAGAFVWMYGQGRKDGDWMGQGLRFGLAVSLVGAIPFFFIYHAVAQFPLDLAIKQSIGDTAAFLLAGLAVAHLNK